MDIIEKAIQFAGKAHEGGLRKGTNLPYILHPIEASTIAARLTEDPEIIAAAALHDVVEDTDYTLEDIQKEFGDRVAELVDSCTENKRRDIPAADTWMIRKQETIEHLKTAPRDVKVIAFSDKLSNLRSMMTDYIAEGESFWNRFQVKEPQKHVWYYSAMLDSFEEFGDSLLYKEYSRLIEKMRMMVQEFEVYGRHNAVGHSIPRPYPFHNHDYDVAYYTMKDLDCITNKLSVTEVINRLSPKFHTRHGYWWVNPLTGVIESLQSLESVDRAAERIVDRYMDWKYDLEPAPEVKASRVSNGSRLRSFFDDEDEKK